MMPLKGFSDYLTELEQNISAGHATEHTYRPALKKLVESLDASLTAVNEPKRIKCGAPDYIVTRHQIPIGHIEAKDVGKSLDKAERSEQLERYLKGFGNLILTDYLEFRWFVGGKHRLTAKLAVIGSKGKLRKDKQGVEQVSRLLYSFINSQAPVVGTPRELASRMAALAQIIRDSISLAFEDEDQGGSLHQQLEGFREILIHDLSRNDFADMYSQTICYGLFAARCNHKLNERFVREHAAYELPRTNPFLRNMFTRIAGPDLDERIAWAVDDLAELLNRCDMPAILADFGKKTRREDPVVHFYESFLAAYDPKMRKVRGVYYTPEPVVSYIVRSIDHILKKDFKLPDGLADNSKIKIKKSKSKDKIEIHKVQILDPAAGTGTFLQGVINRIHEKFINNQGMWSGYVCEHLLPRLFGFELLMAPYAVAHMKLGLQLAETGYDFGSQERLRIYLTNSLEEAHKWTGLPLFTQWLADEAEAANRIKKDAPVMVVLGNPPYSGHSANTGKWISGLLRGQDHQTNRPTANYFQVDGQPLGERNPKWLNDDYVKFIRFAQWRIEQTGYGILAFISNHGYLDNPTFRGMRQSLMATFNDIYILDLHGNTKKKETALDGSKDENVFDIQQGVTIGIFVKSPGSKKKQTVVRHAELWGLRQGKYRWLWENELATTDWTTLKPQSPFYFFIPQDTGLQKEYEKGWNITEIMPVNGVGMTTARDHVVIDFEETPLIQRAKLFRDSTASDEELCRQLDIPLKKGWNISRARKLIKAETDLKQHIKPILYRPFDSRLIFYHDSLVWRTVKQIMYHMLTGNNLGLSFTRPQSPKYGFSALVSGKMIDQCVVGNKSAGAGISYLAPLYIYYNGSLPNTGNNRKPNLSPEFIADFSRKLGMNFNPHPVDVSACPQAETGKNDTISNAFDRKQNKTKMDSRFRGNDKSRSFGPEEVFYYMYAVFHAPTYRSRYAEFLKRDFPRLPLTSNQDLFRSLCDLGQELVGLHLMEKEIDLITTYPQTGDSKVEKVRYTEPGQGAERGRVWINEEQYFEGVSPEVWNFQIGGYQVCHKWLKDRKGRRLTYQDLTCYQQVVAALKETIRLMGEIDLALDQRGGWPIK